MRTTGRFWIWSISSNEAILNKSLADILKELPLSDEVKQALSGKPNKLRETLDYILCYEKGAWNELNGQPITRAISANRFMNLYVDALKWAKDVGSF
jgi:EAL and modified HD-GYP domain-containing signal transduction protein